MASASIPSPYAQSVGVLLPAFTLWWREIVRFYRQRARVVGVILSPLLFWIVIGSGFGTSFRSGESAGQQHYLDYFFPGAMVMIILFTSIFTMMSVIEDRNEGFLLSVLVAPVPRSAIVLGKVLGGTTLADRKSTRLNSSHLVISYAVFCLKKKTLPAINYAELNNLHPRVGISATHSAISYAAPRGYVCHALLTLSGCVCPSAGASPTHLLD